MAISTKFLDTLRGVTEDNYEKKLAAILNPDPDEVKAGKAYKRVMGYDPITYHTDHKITSVLKAAEAAIPELHDAVKELESNIRVVIHDEIREVKKEIIATVIFDALIGASTDITIDVRELKQVIEETLDVMDVIEAPEDLDDPEVDVYDLLMEDDDENEVDLLFDDEDDDF